MKPKFLGLRASAIIEIAIFFVLAVIVDIVFFSGTRFVTIEPHPFWIIVVLISVQYGTNEGLLAAIVASIVLLAFNIPEQRADQNLYDFIFSLIYRPLLWLVSAVIIGELRRRQIRERDMLYSNLAESKERENKITDAYGRLKLLKENLEIKISGQLRSAIMAYDAAQNLEKLYVNDVINGAISLVQTLMNPEKFSIFLLEGDKLVCKVNQGWDGSDKYSSEFNSQSVLYQSVVGNNKHLCIANKDDEKLLSEEGILAGPIVSSRSNQVVGMLKIEKLGFLDFSITTLETFKILCQWIGNAYVNSTSYQRLKEGSLYNPDHNIYSTSFYNKQLDFIKSLSKRINFDASQIVIKINNAANLSSSKRKEVAIKIGEIIHSTLRRVDQVFDFNIEGEEFALILPGTSVKNAEVVVMKVKNKINNTAELKDAHFSFVARELNSKEKN